MRGHLNGPVQRPTGPFEVPTGPFEVPKGYFQVSKMPFRSIFEPLIQFQDVLRCQSSFLDTFYTYIGSTLADQKMGGVLPGSDFRPKSQKFVYFEHFLPFLIYLDGTVGSRNPPGCILTRI